LTQEELDNDMEDQVLLIETAQAIANIEEAGLYGESPSLDRIFAIAGCPYMSINMEILTAPRCHAKTNVLPDCLGRLLHAIVRNPSRLTQDITSVVSGILRHEVWEYFLLREDDTYALSRGVLFYLEDYEPSFPLDAALADDMCKLLNTWLKPKVLWTTLPCVEDVTDHMFGSAWLHLIKRPSMDPGWGETIGDMAFDDRPPFLPGVCPAQVITLGVALPDIGLEP
jgi:hypothetical protein